MKGVLKVSMLSQMNENGASKMSVDLFLLDMVTPRINLKIIKKFNLFQTENRNVIFSVIKIHLKKKVISLIIIHCHQILLMRMKWENVRMKQKNRKNRLFVKNRHLFRP